MLNTLSKFTTESLFNATSALLGKLNIQFDRETAEPINVADLYDAPMPQYLTEALQSVDNTYFIGIVNDESLQGQKNETSLQEIADTMQHEGKYDGLIVFACNAKTDVSLTRSTISALTRAFNRISYANPVILIIRQGHLLSLATCERSNYNQEWRQCNGEKVGKVTMLRNVNCLKLHAGHRQILEKVAKDVKGSRTFEDLYNNWLSSFCIDILSDAFFEGYKSIYEDVIEYVTGKRMVKEGGKWVEKNNNTPCADIMEEFAIFADPEKAVRDYVKNLMGRLVFIQFLQKKGWMGVPIGDKWEGGDPYFLQNLFANSDKKDTFIDDVLEPLFNDLNTKRHGDLVTNQNVGTNIKVPYLNGGLFELDESDDTTFALPSEFIKNLLDFFASYNFTIDENAPENVEIGVDPEMLGRIFENLLEDNKEKGAFYTPKNVVQYMCRESLIAYLTTCIIKKQGENHNPEKDIRDSVRKLLENPEEIVPRMTEEHLRDFGRYIRDVKICDPAIGSGAFPMGLLNELVRCRVSIKAWAKDAYGNLLEEDYAALKADIICNNIYGVDIEKGAIDIARLRFWLSIIVDLTAPHALPNFDYKFMQGNSLITTFNEEYVNLDTKNQKHVRIVEMRAEKQNLYGLKLQYYASQGNRKHELAVEIKKSILRLVSMQIGYELRAWYNNNAVQSSLGFDGQSEDFDVIRRLLPKEKKELVAYAETLYKLLNDRSVDVAKRALIDINFFDWRMMFTEVFDAENGGFDIVIGNPPYGVSIKGDYRTAVESVLGKVPDYEIYYYFIELSKSLLRDKGLLSYIVPNTWLFNTFAKNYRENIFKIWKVEEVLDCSKFKIFHSATVMNTILRFIKTTRENEYVGYRNTNNAQSFTDIIREQYNQISINDVLAMNQNWGLVFRLNGEKVALVNKISSNGRALRSYFPEISQGLIAYDKYRGQSAEIIKNRAYHYSEYHEGLKKMIWGEDVTRYAVNWNGKEWIDYCEGIANPRQPKFFKGKRMLVREITNPSIFATITMDELYNDPAVIVVLDSNNYKIESALGILNSKIATFYHFNHSPKATKGSFPKILVQDVKEFPLPSINEEIDSFISSKVIHIMSKKATNIDNDTLSLENEIDRCVYELYGLTNAEVKIIDPNEITVGSNDELFKAKNSYE